MIVRDPRRRRLALLGARTGAVASAAMLAFSGWALLSPDVGPATAATDGGAVQVITPHDGTPDAGHPLGSGGSLTAFSLALPTGAACTGDSAGAGYRVQTYMVPESVDPGALQFNANGPTPAATGAAFRQPLYSTSSSPYVDQQTANADTPNGPGFVVNIPAFDFSVYDQAGLIPAGTYNIGIACTLGPASATQVDTFWNGKLTVTAAPADQPAGIAWTALAAPATTTTTSTTSTTSTSTTSTTKPGSTTTTADPDEAGGTTTTTDADGAGGSTTTTPDGGTGTTTPAEVLGESTSDPSGGTPTGTPIVESVSQLPMTGGSPVSLLVWSALLLVFGRMAILLARTSQVRPAIPLEAR